MGIKISYTSFFTSEVPFSDSDHFERRLCHLQKLSKQKREKVLIYRFINAGKTIVLVANEDEKKFYKVINYGVKKVGFVNQK